MHIYNYEPASWPSGNAFVSVVRDLRLKPRAGQMEYSVANAATRYTVGFAFIINSRGQGRI